MREFNEDWFALLVAVVLCVLITSGGVWFMKAQCDAKARGLGYPHKWGIVSGCQVQIGNSWVPLENVRVFEGKP